MLLFRSFERCQVGSLNSLNLFPCIQNEHGNSLGLFISDLEAEDEDHGSSLSIIDAFYIQKLWIDIQSLSNDYSVSALRNVSDRYFPGQVC